jgi:hypothetical protein
MYLQVTKPWFKPYYATGKSCNLHEQEKNMTIFIPSMQEKFEKNSKDDIQGNAQGLLYLITA